MTALRRTSTAFAYLTPLSLLRPLATRPSAALRRAVPLSSHPRLAFCSSPALGRPNFDRCGTNTSTNTTTTRTKTRMAADAAALPSTETIHATRFPETVGLAADILRAAPAPLPPAHARCVRDLLASGEGARGLFVTLLTDPGVTAADAEPLDDALVRTIAAATTPDARELAVKNVVMSAAMVVHYGAAAATAEGHADEQAREQMELRDQSATTCARAKRVLLAWHRIESEAPGSQAEQTVRDVAAQMYASISGSSGKFDGFIAKWGYTDGQRAAMAVALLEVFDGFD